MKTYELTYIVSPEAGSEEAEAKAKEIEAFVLAGEGAVSRQEKPVAKALSYPIKKHASGFVGSIEFSIEPEKLIELQEKMQKDGKIVRHMVIIKEPVKIRKERRSRLFAQTKEGVKPEVASAEIVNEQKEEPKKVTEEKPKVELKDIEERLDEILGQ